MNRGSGRGGTLLRVLLLMRMLEGLSHPVALRTLADRFGVCRRTIRRDLTILEESGAQVELIHGKVRRFEWVAEAPSTAVASCPASRPGQGRTTGD